MVVNYGDPGPTHGWQNYFDLGEYQFGRLANSLELGCDCLGEITYARRGGGRRPLRTEDHPQRDLHPRRGLRRAVEAQRLLHRHFGDPAPAPPGRVVLRHRRQLRLRLLLVLHPRRDDRAGGQGHRDPLPVRLRRRRPVLRRARARARRAGAPAPVLRPARPHRRRRAQPRRRTRGGAGPDGRGQPVGQRDRPQAHAAAHRSRCPAGRGEPPRPGLGRVEHRPHQPAGPAHVVRPAPARAADPPRGRGFVDRPPCHVRPQAPVGDAVRPRRAVAVGLHGQPEPGRRRPAGLRGGRPRRSTARTSCCGTRSG